MRDLNQNAGAVAGSRIATARAAVRQIDENFNAVADDLVRLLAAEVHDKAHPAGVVFVTGIVETLRSRQAHVPEYLIVQYYVNRNYELVILVKLML